MFYPLQVLGFPHTILWFAIKCVCVSLKRERGSAGGERFIHDHTNARKTVIPRERNISPTKELKNELYEFKMT